MMRIVECLWKEEFVDKFETKHRVATVEVEELFGNTPLFSFVAKGNLLDEDVYRALGRTDAGRYLVVFFIYKHGGKALPISARDMDKRERRRYGRK